MIHLRQPVRLSCFVFIALVYMLGSLLLGILSFLVYATFPVIIGNPICEIVFLAYFRLAGALWHPLIVGLFYASG